MFNAEFWVAAGFVAFVGVLFYYDAPTMILKALDKRRARIIAELEEAIRIREEAERLFIEYEAKLKKAEAQADAIVEHAEREAERLIQLAKDRMDEFVERHTKIARAKIAQAEAQALADVKAAAGDAAVSAAERILTTKLKGDAADALTEKSIAQIKSKLN